MATKAVVKKPNGTTELVQHQPTPMEMLSMAISQGADLDKLSKLMDLQERWEKNEARKAFIVAMNDFKKAPPVIQKNKHVKFGNTEYDHATLDHVTAQITAGLSQHGLSHAWKVDQTADRIKVTCTVTHEQGHAESVTMESEPDKSGAKNSIQAIASAVSYLERYTLLAATGLAAGGADNDASSYSNGDMAQKLEYIDNCRTLDELKTQFEWMYKEARERRDEKAQRILSQAKDRKKAELEGR